MGAYLRPVLVAICLAGTLAGCDARVDVGSAAYLGHCTDCHGADARGGGPLAGLFASGVPDLTSLAAANGGSFPEAYVIRAIGTPSGVHGGITAMPDYVRLLSGAPATFTAPDGSVIDTTDTVLALTAYLRTLQD
jgi:mono/diheme cytochrome c family protein